MRQGPAAGEPAEGEEDAVKPVKRRREAWFDFGGTEEWMEQAACRQMPTELFFPERGEDATAAKAVCNTCPVIAECREYALSLPHWTDGVFGATTPRERSRIRAERRRVA